MDKWKSWLPTFIWAGHVARAAELVSKKRTMRFYGISVGQIAIGFLFNHKKKVG